MSELPDRPLSGDGPTPLRRFAESLWVAVPALTLGWLAGAAFLYAGLRARKPVWAGFGALYGITGILGRVLLPGSDATGAGIEDVGLALSAGTLAVATAHALFIRRAYLDRIGAGDPSPLDAAERTLAERERALAIAREDPLRARQLGIGQPGLPGGYDGHLVDLNHAPPGAIAALPRIGDELAARIVDVREEVQGFDSVDDAAHLLDLPPATVDRLRELAVCLPY